MRNYKKIGILLIILFSFVGCSSVKKREEAKTLEQGLVQNINYSERDGEQLYTLENNNGTEFIEVYDPLEPFNRRMYAFNYYLDKYLLIPAVNTYEFITPDPMEKGVTNFFRNLQQIPTFINSVLQLKGRKATASLVRFGINSTFGIFGIFDVATRLEIPQTYEDFGLTFARYGIGNGPYLVLPGLGPTNLRDGVGRGISSFAVGTINPYDPEFGIDVTSPYSLGLEGIDARKKVKSFRYYGTESPFEYEYIRFLYTKYREEQIKVNNGGR